MADSKITALASIGTGTDPANDPLVIVDVSDILPGGMSLTGTTKKVTLNNLLACSPTATLASATITGDLTVDTNTLKVVSATDSVGVGFTPSAWGGGRKAIQIGSPAQLASADLTLEIGSNWWHDGTNYKYTAANPAALYSPSNGSHAWYNASAGLVNGTIGWSTLMTLNSTGLGVGVSPAAKFDSLVADAAESARFRAASGWLRIFGYVDATDKAKIQATNNTNTALQTLTLEGLTVRFNTNNGTALNLNANGAAALMGASTTANGVGITFPAAQVASSDANTLDDYEEGTFTPIVSGLTTAGTGIYTTQVGRYTKIGRLVQFQLRIAWTAHTGTGNMVIDQLPFVSSNVANSFGSVSIGYANGLALTASNIATAVVEVNASYVLLFQYPVGGGSATNVPVDTAADLMITGTYTV